MIFYSKKSQKMKIKFIKIFFFLPLAIFSHNVFSVSIIQDWNGPFEFLHGTVGLTNSNQYAITMTATQTNIRTLVVSEYSTRSGNTCTGSPSATATMTASADETFSSGVTYAATNDSSWYMVNNNGGGTDGKSSDFNMVRLVDDNSNFERYEPE